MAKNDPKVWPNERRRSLDPIAFAERGLEALRAELERSKGTEGEALIKEIIKEREEELGKIKRQAL